MDAQLVLVALVVAAALAYLGRRAWRTWAGSKAGCGGGCACPGKPQAPASAGDAPANGLISAEQLTARIRRRGGGP